MKAMWERVKTLFMGHKIECVIILVTGYVLGRLL